MENNINNVISNALLVNKYNLNKNIKTIINEIKNTIFNNKDLIEKTCLIDKERNNGFMIDFNIINNIFSNLEKETLLYGDVILSEKDEKQNIIYGKEIFDIGNVIVINDGNPYTILEMIIRNIMAGNTTIFSNNGFMYGTNQLIIVLVQTILEKFNISKHLIQIFISQNFDDVLSNYSNINLVICIGDHNLQRMILNKSKNRIIISGYENFDLYIEDTTHIDFLNKILNTGLNINLYIKEDTKLDYYNSIIVNDIDEAIAQINYNGSKYSCSIFTNSKENASKFIKEVKSNIVTVNTSPTIERIIDIKQEDLIIEKKIIYPFNFKLDGSNETVDIN